MLTRNQTQQTCGVQDISLPSLSICIGSELSAEALRGGRGLGLQEGYIEKYHGISAFN